MAQTNVNIRMDEDVKQQADKLFKELGLNMTTAVNVFVKQAIRQGRIPFVISAAPNAETIAAMEDVNNHINLIGPFDSVDEMMRSLNADD